MHRTVFEGFSLSSSEVEASAVLKRLFLVGVDHGDPRGFGRTLELLHTRKADLILLELSPFARSFRARRQRHLVRTLNSSISRAAHDLALSAREAHRHPEVMRVRRQMCLPFEYRAARRYAMYRNARIVLCDSSHFSRRCLATWPQMISSENMRGILSGPGRAKAHVDGYAMARRALGEHPAEEMIWTRAVESRWGSWWDRREHHLARSVWTALHVLQPRTPLALGGWQHLLQGRFRPTLRGLLHIPPSRCLLLPDDSSPETSSHRPCAEQYR